MRAKALSYSSLDLHLSAYRITLGAQEWGCVAELMDQAPHGVNDEARDFLELWAAQIARAYDLEPRRRVPFEAPKEWADFLWYVLTLPAAEELEDVARDVRRQVQRSNRETVKRNRDAYWKSLRAMARAGR
jgi:hypothetical protein